MEWFTNIVFGLIFVFGWSGSLCMRTNTDGFAGVLTTSPLTYVWRWAKKRKVTNILSFYTERKIKICLNQPSHMCVEGNRKTPSQLCKVTNVLNLYNMHIHNEYIPFFVLCQANFKMFKISFGNSFVINNMVLRR